MFGLFHKKIVYGVYENYRIYMTKVFNKYEYLNYFVSSNGHGRYGDSAWLSGKQKDFAKEFSYLFVVSL